METNLQITVRDVYGVAKAYPANEQAKRLASMLGTKTLTLQALRDAQAMGFTISHVDRFGAVQAFAEAFSKLS